jgi:hypothetical protein
MSGGMAAIVIGTVYSARLAETSPAGDSGSDLIATAAILGGIYRCIYNFDTKFIILIA